MIPSKNISEINKTSNSVITGKKSAGSSDGEMLDIFGK
jgi:hypothetical protein